MLLIVEFQPAIKGFDLANYNKIIDGLDFTNCPKGIIIK